LCISLYCNALWRWHRCFNYLFINNYFHLTNHHTDNQVSHYTGGDLIYTSSLWYTGNNSKVQGRIDLQKNNNNRVSTIRKYSTLLKGDFSESRFSILFFFFFSKHWYLLLNNLTYVLDWSTSTLTFFYFYQIMIYFNNLKIMSLNWDAKKEEEKEKKSTIRK
jgi:hypothetical protein